MLYSHWRPVLHRVMLCVPLHSFAPFCDHCYFRRYRRPNTSLILSHSQHVLYRLHPTPEEVNVCKLLHLIHIPTLAYLLVIEQ